MAKVLLVQTCLEIPTQPSQSTALNSCRERYLLSFNMSDKIKAADVKYYQPFFI